MVSSRTSERQRTRGAYVVEFGSTGISDVSGIGSSAVVSATGSSATSVGVIGTSLDVEGPSNWGSRDAPGGQRSKYVCSSVTKGVMPRKLFLHLRNPNVIPQLL